MSPRVRIAVRGAVQGVGFRPFVYRLASELDLAGWVQNTPSGVFIEAEAPRDRLDSFLFRLGAELPPRAHIQSLESSMLDPAGYQGFEIRKSEGGSDITAIVLPDIAPCADCLREMMDPTDRRYRYPFTNCTNCGPRFSIIEALPYDRPNTSMKQFSMCAECEREYADPADRRFHAQPIACPACGPALALRSPSGERLSAGHDALLAAASAIRSGSIVAVKSVGGFHLMVRADDNEAVTRLRERKHREEKPFALMYGSVGDVRLDCAISELEERALRSPECPIVILRRLPAAGRIVAAVAPGNPCLGAMLPPSPLHHLLLAETGMPVVATSGNLSDEPICIDEAEALERLAGIADSFLSHDRTIVRHVDDSIVRIAAGREMVLRRARGFAPLPIRIGSPAAGWLGVGAHLKNSVAVGIGQDVFLSQHIGDLENQEALGAFERAISGLTGIYRTVPARVAADLHPDYLSTRHARSTGLPVSQVQHHFAHVASCMAENELQAPVLGVAWDGTGFGPDGTVWGGEFLIPGNGTFERFATFRRFPLPGGESAIREPRRSALGAMYEILGNRLFEEPRTATVSRFSPEALRSLRTMLERKINCPRTSSVGRLFDAVASILGLRQVVRYEGQAAMELEYAADGTGNATPYPFHVGRTGQAEEPRSDHALWTVDWEPVLKGVVDDTNRGPIPGEIPARFHATLAGIIVAVAAKAGLERVVLTGGCFQNRLLLEGSIAALESAGHRVYWHQRVPTNDGGIALGQVFAAACLLRQN